ncbi:MAG TPA: hypothetical protein VGN42_16145 [Pirellulales bacterium]|nr:hypothetical protein [Pirellulales bacterium]
MYRALACLAALTAVAAPANAEEVQSPKETLVRLSVSAAAAPQPALKYVLLPEFNELNPGNPIQNYMKCFMEREKFFMDKEEVERREQLSAMPLAELPANELQDYGGSALRQADWAARLDTPDWQMLLQMKQEGYRLLIPDVQQMRVLARALKVRFRAEVAMGRFDAALGTAQTMFAMSQHLGEHLTLIGELVGVAVAQSALDPLEEMIQQPGCPNLYWALTYLPSPLMPPGKSAQGERITIEPTFRDLDGGAAMSAERLDRLIDSLSELSEGSKALPAGGLRAWLAARSGDESVVNAARRRLVENGAAEERLRQFPAEQVLLLDQKRACLASQDDVMKLSYLPIWQIDEMVARVRSKEPVVFDLAPAIERVARARARLDQRISLLRHVESLRLYAAEHGKFPEKQSELWTPLPVDPMNGQPLGYELDGTTAHLRGSAPKGEEQNPSFNLHYEVTLRK